MCADFRAWYLDIRLYLQSNERVSAQFDDLAQICRVRPSEVNRFNSFIENALKKSLIEADGFYTRKAPTAKKTLIVQKPIETPGFNEFLFYAKEQVPDVSESALRLKYQSWVENDWHTAKDRPIKNWKTTLLNTISHLPKEPIKTNEPKVGRMTITTATNSLNNFK